MGRSLLDPQKQDAPALVVLSGGQDSTTCLFWAKRKFRHVHAISFMYGQRHAQEVYSAQRIARMADVESHETVWIEGLMGGALTDPTQAIGAPSDGLPNTFLPGRNLVFLTMALSAIIRIRAKSPYVYENPTNYIVTGVCQTDYSGYPDCRHITMERLERAMEAGTDQHVIIDTPLMNLTKAETVQMAHDLGPECWEALRHTVTCYEGNRPGCGVCPACVLRRKGFDEMGLADPSFSFPEV